MISIAHYQAPAPGDQVAPFVVQTRAGSPYSWKPGRTTVICFCAMWCDTWKDQLPRLSKSENMLRGLPVDYLAITVDGRWMERSAVGKYASLLADSGGAWSHSMGIDRVPYTLVLDSAGRIRWSTHGIFRSEDLVNQVRAALAPRTAGKLYLTFDGINDDLLDLLRKEEIKASFIDRVGISAALSQRAIREGHQRIAANRVLRQPNGEISILNRFIDDPYDLMRPGKTELVRRILNKVRPEAVIYLHGGVSDTLAELPNVISNLKSRGYTFEVLEENITSRSGHR